VRASPPQTASTGNWVRFGLLSLEYALMLIPSQAPRFFVPYTVSMSKCPSLSGITPFNSLWSAMVSIRWSPLLLGCTPSTTKQPSSRTLPSSLHISPSIPRPSPQHFPILYSPRPPTQLPLTLSIPLSLLNQGKLYHPNWERVPTRQCSEPCPLPSRQRSRQSV
jgi:hypothetical protein